VSDLHLHKVLAAFGLHDAEQMICHQSRQPCFYRDLERTATVWPGVHKPGVPPPPFKQRRQSLNLGSGVLAAGAFAVQRGTSCERRH